MNRRINLGQSLKFVIYDDSVGHMREMSSVSKFSRLYYKIYRDLAVIDLLAANIHSNLENELKYESRDQY